MKTIPLLGPLEADLERVERKLREPVHPDYPQLTAVLQHLLDSGGKRLRPALALLAGSLYAADGASASESLISLAASVEMLHTATLVHDDLIDGALLRRGNPTLNTDWSPGATVLTGDYLFARSAALAAETGSVQVMHIFASTLMTICSGELRQMFGRRALPCLGDEQSWQLALQRYDQRIHAKTASLFAGATEAASVLGQAPVAESIALRDYGCYLGMGFQIIDDVLDFQGDENVLGKPVGSDLREGIVTLPVLYYLRANPDDERVAVVVRDGRNGGLVREVVDAIRESGAAEQSTERARHFIVQSQDALAALPQSRTRTMMHELAEYAVSRKK